MAAKIDRLGETRMMNCGMQASIIRYNWLRDIDVRFEDGAIATCKDYKMFRKGGIAHPSTTAEGRLGETRMMSCGMKATIIRYENADDINICFEDGNPIEKTNIEKRFKKFIKVNNLREVVFHSLRHSSATYKLKLSKGDIKATQGDTGHKSADMITKRYAHIIDEDRKVNATKFEDEFYASKENEEKDDASELLDILKNNDALREQLKKMLSL